MSTRPCAMKHTILAVTLAALLGIAVARGASSDSSSKGCKIQEGVFGYHETEKSLNVVKDVTSAAKCCQECQDTEGCNAFAYCKAEAGSCKFKYKNEGEDMATFDALKYKPGDCELFDADLSTPIQLETEGESPWDSGVLAALTGPTQTNTTGNSTVDSSQTACAIKKNTIVGYPNSTYTHLKTVRKLQSASDCCHACQGQKGCNAFTYCHNTADNCTFGRGSDSEGDPSSILESELVPGDCELLDADLTKALEIPALGIPPLDCGVVKFNGTSTNTSANATGCNMQLGKVVVYPDGFYTVLKTKDGVDSAADCCSACAKEEFCSAFTYCHADADSCDFEIEDDTGETQIQTMDRKPGSCELLDADVSKMMVVSGVVGKPPWDAGTRLLTPHVPDAPEGFKIVDDAYPLFPDEEFLDSVAGVESAAACAECCQGQAGCNLFKWCQADADSCETSLGKRRLLQLMKPGACNLFKANVAGNPLDLHQGAPWDYGIFDPGLDPNIPVTGQCAIVENAYWLFTQYNYLGATPKVASAQDCCDLCQQAPECNIFEYCRLYPPRDIDGCKIWYVDNLGYIKLMRMVSSPGDCVLYQADLSPGMVTPVNIHDPSMTLWDVGTIV